MLTRPAYSYPIFDLVHSSYSVEQKKKNNKINFADYFLLTFLFVNALQCNIYAFINFKCWVFFYFGGGVIFKGSGLLLLLLFWVFFPYLFFGFRFLSLFYGLTQCINTVTLQLTYMLRYTKK